MNTGPDLNRNTDQAISLDGIQLVIFDFDGVVADSEVLSLGTLQTALKEFGLPLALDEVRSKFLGSSLATISAYVAAHSPSRSDNGFSQAWQSRLFAAFRDSLSPIPGIVSLLERLKARNIAYCVASSSSFERLGIALDAMALTDSFPAVFSAEQVSRGKPAPDLFLLAAERMEMDPAACLVIEDSPHGVTAARAAGMRAVGFVGGQHLQGLEREHASLLRSHGAELIVTGFENVCSD